MAKFAGTLGLVFMVLGSASAWAQKTWTIEEELDGTAYHCIDPSDSGVARFVISFDRVRRHKGGRRLVASFSGTLNSEAKVDSADISAQIDMIDPIHKKFEIDISDFPSISLFHGGRARHLKTRAYFNSAYDTINGELSYVIGRKRDGNRTHEKLSYQCVIVARTGTKHRQ